MYTYMYSSALLSFILLLSRIAYPGKSGGQKPELSIHVLKYWSGLDLVVMDEYVINSRNCPKLYTLSSFSVLCSTFAQYLADYK